MMLSEHPPCLNPHNSELWVWVHCFIAHFQTVLLELELAEKQRMMKKRQKACIYLKRVVINIITVVCLGGCFALIYYVVEVWKPMVGEHLVVKNTQFNTIFVYLLLVVRLVGFLYVNNIFFKQSVLWMSRGMDRCYSQFAETAVSDLE